jgi:hypothetical protein
LESSPASSPSFVAVERPARIGQKDALFVRIGSTTQPGAARFTIALAAGLKVVTSRLPLDVGELVHGLEASYRADNLP